MSTPERADPFGVGDLDVSGFAPAAGKKTPPTRAAIRKISEENHFPSRAPAMMRAQPKSQRRRRTGRNAQINIKATQETIDRLAAISDRQSWVFGETLQHALDALEQSLVKKG
jgi:hypothetical protein